MGAKSGRLPRKAGDLTGLVPSCIMLPRNKICHMTCYLGTRSVV